MNIILRSWNGLTAMVGALILIAEDERHSRLSLYLALKKEGFSVVTAEDGIDAYSKITQYKDIGKPFDLLITDYMMPKLNGIELIDKLMTVGIKLPTIMITGYGNNDLVGELKQRGNIDYLDKPFAPQKILKRIETNLKRF